LRRDQRPSRARSLPGAREGFFKILDRAFGLRVLARASRKLAIADLAQHAAERPLGDNDAEFLENPWAKIDDPTAHDPMNRRDRPALEDCSQRRPMLVVQPRRLPRRLAVDPAFPTMRIEPDHPVANDLQSDAANLRRPGAARAVVNRRNGQPAVRLRTILRRFAAARSAPAS
jgi:hypothetical protein